MSLQLGCETVSGWVATLYVTGRSRHSLLRCAHPPGIEPGPAVLETDMLP